ncbi:unnamed protein product [Medioppia subpectinata]|uniref:Uncharacterized protein n=1 Tax=Medioppia subpectinata TaxID=1979941 RepID=A0A7R9KKD8_9ACAR|nr:unnamed protein product [Medioppia subpectinata]CAG2105339.1 unnamed protein product [Medioppia subpectinata]
MKTYLWLQGDICRNKTSTKNQNLINNNNEDIINKNYSDGSLVKCHLLDNDNNAFNLITGEVKSLDLNDDSSKLENNERGRKPRKCVTNLNTSGSEELETQGDQLNRIKAQRRNARSATTSTTPSITVKIDDMRSHRRSTSQPKEDIYISPLKSLKPQQIKSTTVSIYNTRSAIRRGKTVPIEDQTDKLKTTTDNQTDEISISSVKYLKKLNDNLNNAKNQISSNTKTGVWRHVVVPIHVVPVQEIISDSSSSSASNSESNAKPNSAKLDNWYAIPRRVKAIGSVTVWQLVVQKVQTIQ